MKNNQNNLLLFLLSVISASTCVSQTAPVTAADNSIIISGMIMEKGSSQSLAYVSIGIPDKSLGTVADSTGHFTMIIQKENLTDSLLISLVGYESRKVSISEFVANNNHIIELSRKYYELQEIVIGNKQQMVSEVAGRKSDGRTLQFSFIDKNAKANCLGSEIGMKIRPGKVPAILQDFNWNFSGNNLASIKFRVNVYSLKNNLPDTLLSRSEIYTTVTNSKTGWNKVDLTAYHITVNSDFVISLEWVENSVNENEKPKVLLPGGISFSNTSYFRLASQDKWRKGSVIISFNVTLLH